MLTLLPHESPELVAAQRPSMPRSAPLFPPHIVMANLLLCFPTGINGCARVRL